MASAGTEAWEGSRKMRVFIGIALPSNIRQALADDAEKLCKTIPGRYVPKDYCHITMEFIGERVWLLQPLSMGYDRRQNR